MLKNYSRYLFLIIIVFLLAGCSRTGTYSILLTSNVQFEQNPLNELPGQYNKKRVIVPASIVTMSDENKKKWMDTLNYFTVHTIDTTVKISILDEFGTLVVNASACRNHGLAIVVHDASDIIKNGKYIQMKLRYVCMDDDIDMTWAATHDYKIDNVDECYDGFHSIEYQFSWQKILKDKEKQALKNVFVVCAKD